MRQAELGHDTSQFTTGSRLGAVQAGQGCSTHQHELELGQVGPGQATAPAGKDRGEEDHIRLGHSTHLQLDEDYASPVEMQGLLCWTTASTGECENCDQGPTRLVGLCHRMS